MENKKNDVTLFLMTQLILTYRVSLYNLSKIFYKDQDELYNQLLEYNSDETIQGAIKYVLNHETMNEPKEIQELAKKQVRLFLINLNRAKTSKEKVDLINSLNNDKATLNLRYKDHLEYTNDEILQISRYRLKYALGRTYIHDIFGITADRLKNKEKYYDDETLKLKLQILNVYKDYRNDSTAKIRR